MIDNVYGAITDYAEAYKQARMVYNQAVKHIKANYKEDGDMFNDAMNTAYSTLTSALEPICNTCKEIVKKDFDDARKAVATAVSVSPSADVMSILPMIREGKLNETELQMFLEAHKGNYMDTKMIYDALGKNFVSVESVVSNLDMVEQKISSYFKTFKGEPLDKISYNNAVVMNGRCIEELGTLTDDFLNTYGVQEAE